MRAEIALEFGNESLKVPHPVSRIIGIHECWFKPANCSSLEKREDEENLPFIISKNMMLVSEVKVTRDQKISEFSRIRTVKCIRFSDLNFLQFWGCRLLVQVGQIIGNSLESYKKLCPVWVWRIDWVWRTIRRTIVGIIIGVVGRTTTTPTASVTIIWIIWRSTSTSRSSVIIWIITIVITRIIIGGSATLTKIFLIVGILTLTWLYMLQRRWCTITSMKVCPRSRFRNRRVRLRFPKHVHVRSTQSYWTKNV